jgi:uncharacterized protein
MSEIAWNPLRLDVQAFAHAGARLEGAWPAVELTRFAEAGGEHWPAVRFALQGEEVAVLGGAPEIWLKLQVSAEAEAECQRCLQAVKLPLQLDLRTRFVRREEEAAALDAEQDEDVLVLSRRFDLREWVEDELLLALPIVPMHEHCPEPLPVPAEPVEAEEVPAEHPFAALAALRGKGSA